MDDGDGDADADVPHAHFDFDSDNEERDDQLRTNMRRESSLQLSSVIIGFLDAPLGLSAMLHAVITLLTAWRALFPDESPWSIFKTYCEYDDDDDAEDLTQEQFHRTEALGYVFSAYMHLLDARLSRLDADAQCIQQEKDPSGPDHDRAFDSCNPRLTKTLIDAAIASADASTKIWVEKKESEAAIAKARAESAAAEALAKLAAANARAEARPSRAERRKHKKTPVTSSSAENTPVISTESRSHCDIPTEGIAIKKTTTVVVSQQARPQGPMGGSPPTTVNAAKNPLDIATENTPDISTESRRHCDIPTEGIAIKKTSTVVVPQKARPQGPSGGSPSRSRPRTPTPGAPPPPASPLTSRASVPPPPSVAAAANAAVCTAACER